MTPAVTPAAQVRTARAAIWRECGRHFRDSKLVQRRLNYHLAGKFHPGGSQIEFLDRGFLKAAQPAMEIAARAAKEKTTGRGQQRIAQILMQPRHSVPLDAALETIAHHQIVSGAQLREEGF